MTKSKNGNNIFVVAAVAIAMGAVGYFLTSSSLFAPSAPQAVQEAPQETPPAENVPQPVPTSSAAVSSGSAKGSTGTGSANSFVPPGFHMPTGTPHVRGPSGPPPNY